MSPTTKHVFFAFAGLSLCFFNFGRNILHNVVAVLTTYFLTLLLGDMPKAFLAVNFVFQMGYILAGYYSTHSRDYDISWTMPHCLLTLRMVAVGFDLVDGQKPAEELTEEQKLTVLDKPPKLLELFAYSFFPGSCLIGPYYSLKRYQKFHSGEYEKFSGNWQCGLLRCLIGIGYIILRSVGSIYFPDSYMYSDEFAKTSFVERMLHLIIWGKIVLAKYLGCWLITEGSLMCFGLTYAGQRPDGKADWYGCSNVRVVVLETGTKGGHYIDSFNVNTNKWVSQYIYKRLKFLGSKSLSHVLTLLFLAIWHGFHSGYYVAFLFEYIVITFEKQFEAILAETRIFDSECALQRAAIFVVGKLYNLLIMSWSLLPFALRNYDEWYVALASTNYIGMLVMLWFAAIILIYHCFAHSSE